MSTETAPLRAPELEPHCGSWVVVQRTTRAPVLETFDRAKADRIARFESDHFEVLTAARWLAEFNASQK